jgi:hypothetical protein
VQQLHLVGFTTDLEGLIFSARKGSKSGSFVVKIDDGLLSTIDDVDRLRNGEPESTASGTASGSRSPDRRPRPESTLSPREIQARLRAGDTLAEVARAAGVDVDWVGRFAAPILAEQHQVVERARRLTFAKARLGDSAYPLGASVLWNLADRGIRLTERVYESAWRAWNLHGAVWIVEFNYVSRQRGQAAEWEVDLREGTLHNRNRLAADLGYVERVRRRAALPAFEPPEPDGSDDAAAAAKPSRPARSGAASGTGAAGARATAKKTSAAKKAAGSGAPAKKARAAARPGAAKKSAGLKKSAAKKAAKKAAGPKKAAGRKKPAGVKTLAGRKASPTSKGGAASKSAATRKAAPARAMGRKAATAKRVATAKRAAPTKAGAARRAPAVPPTAPTPGPDERVSHLARPVVPPVRRGAARDGTAQAELPSYRPPAGPPREARRPAQAPASPRIERVKGRPQPAATAGEPSSRPERSLRGAALSDPARPRPVVAPPIPTGNEGDSGIVIRRASERVEPAHAQAQGVGQPDRVGRRLAQRPGGAQPESAVAASPDAARKVSTPDPAAKADPRLGAHAADRNAPGAGPRRTPTRADEGQPRADRQPRAERQAERQPRPERQARPQGQARPEGPTERQARPEGPTEAQSRRARQPEPRSIPDAEPQPATSTDERMWHGPGSGEPAPPVRIRADLAAAASARTDDVRRGRKSAGRDRPLRAR